MSNRIWIPDAGVSSVVVVVSLALNARAVNVSDWVVRSLKQSKSVSTEVLPTSPLAGSFGSSSHTRLSLMFCGGGAHVLLMVACGSPASRTLAVPPPEAADWSTHTWMVSVPGGVAPPTLSLYVQSETPCALDTVQLIGWPA
jgi:hypothetical protein